MLYKVFTNLSMYQDDVNPTDKRLKGIIVNETFSF